MMDRPSDDVERQHLEFEPSEKPAQSEVSARDGGLHPIFFIG